MACVNNCPKCGRHKLCRDYLCSDCDGRSARSSYEHRTSMLAGNLRVAALEELRVRYIEARLSANWIVDG